MPWRVGTVSQLRWNFVQEILTLKQPVAVACRKYGISRTTGHKWLRRHQAGEAELVESFAAAGAVAAADGPASKSQCWRCGTSTAGGRRRSGSSAATLPRSPARWR